LRLRGICDRGKETFELTSSDATRTNDIIPDEADKFRSESFNGNLSKVGSVLMVVSSHPAVDEAVFEPPS
jgi:hypothetical protein